MIAYPGIAAFWWPRFLRIAEWFVEFENERRADGVVCIGAELKGNLSIVLDGFSFNLSARVDRIDCLPDGSISIVDYKTGVLPTSKQVESGLTPQLPLEALIIEGGGIFGVTKKNVSKLEYIRLSGARLPGEVKLLNLNLEQVVKESLAGLFRLIQRFSLESTPYLSRPRPQFKSRVGTYDHLARVKEWSYGKFGGTE